MSFGYSKAEDLKSIEASNVQEDQDLLLARCLQHEYDNESFNETAEGDDTFNYEEIISISDSTTDEEDDYDEFESSYKTNLNKKSKNVDLDFVIKNNQNKMSSKPKIKEFDDKKIFSKLKIYSKKEEKYSKRLSDKEEIATSELALDSKTRLILFKLVNSNVINSINGVISTGKESTILYAKGGTNTHNNTLIIPAECIAKVYKTTLNEFRTRTKYIRFKENYKNLNPRKIIKLWARKELHNLKLMRKFNISCPDPIILKHNVLLMSFVGYNEIPAPKLKDAELNHKQLKHAYDQCVDLLRTLFNKCHLIHADFSEYNLLWFDNKIWCIDVSQAISLNHEYAQQYFYRDCESITKFFVKKNLDHLMTPNELFDSIANGYYNQNASLIDKTIQFDENELEKFSSHSSDEEKMLNN